MYENGLNKELLYKLYSVQYNVLKIDKTMLKTVTDIKSIPQNKVTFPYFFYQLSIYSV